MAERRPGAGEERRSVQHERADGHGGRQLAPEDLAQQIDRDGVGEAWNGHLGEFLAVPHTSRLIPRRVRASLIRAMRFREPCCSE